MTNIRVITKSNGKWKVEEFKEKAGGEYTYITVFVEVPHMALNGDTYRPTDNIVTNAITTEEIFDILVKMHSANCLNSRKVSSPINRDYMKAIDGFYSLVHKKQSEEYHKAILAKSPKNIFFSIIEEYNKNKLNNEMDKNKNNTKNDGNGNKTLV